MFNFYIEIGFYGDYDGIGSYDLKINKEIVVKNKDFPLSDTNENFDEEEKRHIDKFFKKMKDTGVFGDYKITKEIFRSYINGTFKYY